MAYAVIIDTKIQTFKSEQQLLNWVSDNKTRTDYTPIRYEELELVTETRIKTKPVTRVRDSAQYAGE